MTTPIIDVTDKLVATIAVPVSVDDLCEILRAHELISKRNGTTCYMRNTNGMIEVFERKVIERK